jgi:hypothetical protein
MRLRSLIVLVPVTFGYCSVVVPHKVRHFQHHSIPAA